MATCTFCNDADSADRLMVSAPNEAAYICEECIGLAVTVFLKKCRQAAVPIGTFRGEGASTITPHARPPIEERVKTMTDKEKQGLAMPLMSYQGDQIVERLDRLIGIAERTCR